MADPAGGGLLPWVFGEKGQVLLAGAAGGIIRWMTLRQSWQEGLISIFSGAICAFYLGPLGTWIFRPIFDEPEQQATMSGFVVGFIGLGIAGFIMDMWKRRKRIFFSEEDDDDRKR